eukprot:3809097-Karenia_brevis.AAC.1
MQPNRLLTYGFANLLSHTSLFLELPEVVTHSLDTFIVHTHHTLSTSQMVAMKEGNLHLRTRKITCHHALRSMTHLDELAKIVNEALITPTRLVGAAP